jgi:hypothetical protein
MLSTVYLHSCCVKLLVNVSGVISGADIGILRVSKDWTELFVVGANILVLNKYIV